MLENQSVHVRFLQDIDGHLQIHKDDVVLLEASPRYADIVRQISQGSGLTK